MKLKHVADMLTGPIAYLGRFAKRKHLVAGHNTGPRYMDQNIGVTPTQRDMALRDHAIKGAPVTDEVDTGIKHREPKRRKIET